MKRKKVLITGASRGVGLHLALEFSKDPSNDLILVARNMKALEEVRSQIQQPIRCLALDLTSDVDLQTLFREIPQVDILVNNAGIGAFGRFTKQKSSELVHMMRLNCEVPVRLMSHYTPKMQSGIGAVVNISSMAGLFPIPFFSIYSATKAFLVEMAAALTPEFKEQGIKLITVCPGGIRTDFYIHADIPDQMIKKYDSTLLTPEQVARATVKAVSGSSGIIVPGFMNVLTYHFSKIIPRKLIIGMLGSVYKKYNRD